jgi:hypothetical protein
MALPGDPQGPITYQVTELSPTSSRLRRKILSGSQLRVIDVTSDCRPYLDMLAEIAAAHEGGTVLT